MFATELDLMRWLMKHFQAVVPEPRERNSSLLREAASFFVAAV